jgi:hypothetical protein
MKPELDERNVLPPVAPLVGEYRMIVVPLGAPEHVVFTIALRETVEERSVTFAPEALKSCHLIGTAEPSFDDGEMLGDESVPAVASGVWKPTKVNGGTVTECGAAPELGLKNGSPE